MPVSVTSAALEVRSWKQGGGRRPPSGPTPDMSLQESVLWPLRSLRLSCVLRRA